VTGGKLVGGLGGIRRILQEFGILDFSAVSLEKIMAMPHRQVYGWEDAQKIQCLP
jgi:hypothetical protein